MFIMKEDGDTLNDGSDYAIVVNYVAYTRVLL